MSDDNKLQELVNYFRSKHIKLSAGNCWLQQCYEWFSSNNQNASIQKLCTFVYQQWLLADLRDIEEKSLPLNLSDNVKFVLTNSYALQVDSIVNVGHSFYSQLQIIRNVSTTNVDITEQKPQAWEPKPGRMLKLTLTDGVQTIFGMEYKPIPALKEPFIPGIKILITGPIECRRGVLLLEASHIQILGGETDSLFISNATENILARTLNLEENMNPFSRSQSSCDTTDVNIENETTLPTTPALPSILDDDEDDIFLCDQLTQIENRINSANNNLSDTDESSHSSVPSITLSSTNPGTTGYNTTMKTPIIGIANPILAAQTHSTFKRSAPSPPSDHKVSKVSMHSMLQQNLSVADSGISSMSGTFSRQNESATTVRDLTANFGRYVIDDVSVVKLTSRPKIKNERWHVSCEIKDKSGVQTVSLADDLLKNIFGYTASQLSADKHRLKTEPSMKEHIDQKLKMGVAKILSLKGKFEIEYLANTDSPTVIRVTEQ